MIEEKIIINIGRQVGSGGHIIAEKLAHHFNIPVFDKEILNLAAKESGFSKKLFEQNDENKGFFKVVTHFRALAVGNNGFYSGGLSQEELFQWQSDAIRKAAKEQGGVFVGRAADYVLRDYNSVVNIFITASFDVRIKTIMKRNHCDVDSAKKFIENKENERTSFYNFYTGKRWGDSSSYDLCINTSDIGIENTTNFIAQFIKLKLGI